MGGLLNRLVREGEHIWEILYAVCTPHETLINLVIFPANLASRRQRLRLGLWGSSGTSFPVLTRRI